MDDPLRRLDEVLRRLDAGDHPAGFDVTPAVQALADSRDAALVPHVSAALDRFVDSHHAEGVDLMAVLLTAVQGVGALPTLLRVAGRDPRPDRVVLQLTIYVLVSQRREECLPTVLASASDPNPGTRRVALWALGRSAERAGRDLVVAALRDGDGQVRATAVQSLVGYRDPADLAVLAPLADDPEPEVRTAVADSMAHIPGPDAARILVRLLSDADLAVRQSAAVALGINADPVAIDALDALARDDDPAVRAAVPRALAYAATPRTDTLLRTLSCDPHGRVRHAAIHGMGFSADQDPFVPFVASMADDPDPDVRSAALRFLFDNRAPATVAVAERQRDDPVAVVRHRARLVLDWVANRDRQPDQSHSSLRLTLPD